MSDLLTSKMRSGLELARFFHETYERLAPTFGYETRPDTKDFSPSSRNGQLMTAVCTEVLNVLQHCETSVTRHQTPNQRAKDTISTMRSMLISGELLYCNEIRLPAEAAKNLLDEFDQALAERDYYISAHGRACQETREALAREVTAARRAPETTATPAERQSLGELFDLMELSEEDAQTGSVSFDASAWRSILAAFWRAHPRYEEALKNTGWSPVKAEGDADGR